MMKLVCVLTLVLGTTSASTDPGDTESIWTQGPAELTSIGPLAFGPKGVLFVADPMAAALFAIDLGAKPALPQQIQVDAIGAKLAAVLGTAENDLIVHDLAISSTDGLAYLAVSRGRGNESVPVIVRVVGETLEVVDLSDVRFARALLSNAPEDDPGSRRNPRPQSITDMVYTDGSVLIAGLSNEEFASKLRSVPYPFESVENGASVEVYHGNHGQLETRSPVRTFLPYTIESESYLLAAYTCTPLVKFPMSALKDGEKVRGTTVAELGGGNAPLDMVAYTKDGTDWLLIANSRHGLMRIDASQLADAKAIEARVRGTAGVEFEIIDYLPGVLHMARLDDGYIVVLMADPDAGTTHLVTIENP